MNYDSSNSYRYGRYCNPISHQFTHESNDAKNIKRFLEIEKSTFEFIKPLALLFFTINIGIMAALFNVSHKYGGIIFILGVGIFASMILLLYSISLLRKSILIIDIDSNKFILSRRRALSCLQWSVYFCLISFELSLVIWISDNIVYVKIVISKILEMITSIENIIKMIVM